MTNTPNVTGIVYNSGKCIKPDCSNDARCRRMCHAHYQRWWKANKNTDSLANAKH